MRYALARTLTLFSLLAFALIASGAHADVGLVTEGSVGRSGFFSDVGHSSVWVSRACVDAQGGLYFCENTAGAVVSGADYWLKSGAAAIPASDYFLGPQDSPAADERQLWVETLGPTYPTLSPELGAKYLGRVWGRQVRVQVFPTTPEQDRLAIAQIQALRDRYRWQLLRSNCADFSFDVLRIWLGKGLTLRHWSDGNITTPVAVEHSLIAALGRAPKGELVTYRFPMPRSLGARRPALDVCSALLFDPKYAAPLLLVDPIAYLGAGYCYAYTHLRDLARSRAATGLSVPARFTRREQSRWTAEHTFAVMTGTGTGMAAPDQVLASAAPGK